MFQEIAVAEEAGCPPEYINIPIPRGHSLFDPNGEGGREMPMLRSAYDEHTGQSPNSPREQVRDVLRLEAFIDR